MARLRLTSCVSGVTAAVILLLSRPFSRGEKVCLPKRYRMPFSRLRYRWKRGEKEAFQLDAENKLYGREGLGGYFLRHRHCRQKKKENKGRIGQRLRFLDRDQRVCAFVRTRALVSCPGERRERKEGKEVDDRLLRAANLGRERHCRWREKEKKGGPSPDAFNRAAAGAGTGHVGASRRIVCGYLRKKKKERGEDR